MSEGISEEQQRLNRLKLASDDGALVERFLNEKIWLDVIEPYLLKEQTEANVACRWSPSMASGKAMSVDEVALKSAYFSGGADSIERLIMRLDGLIREGQEAAKEFQEIDKATQRKA